MAQTQATIRKWMPVAGGFLLFFQCWGPILTFGAFQNYYHDTILSKYSESDISWIGTLSACLLFAGGLLFGPLYDYGHFNYLVYSGSCLVIIGLMTTSVAIRYYEIFLAQCICIGLGASMIWTPTVSLVASQFDPSQRPLALGIMSSGISIGGIVFPIMFQRLLPTLGFGWAVRCCGFVSFAVAVLGLTLFLHVNPARAARARQLIDKSAFTDRPFMSLTASGFFSAFGYYVVLVYLPTFTAFHLTDKVPSGLPFYILSLANGTSTFSRIGAGIIASRFGSLNTFIVALAICSLLSFAWIGVHTVAGLIIWTILWGIASGLIVSLPGAIIPLLTPEVSLIGTRMGLAVSTWGIGMLVGSPAAGATLGRPNAKTAWWPLQVLVAVVMTISLLLCIPPLIHLRAKRPCNS